MDQAAAPPVRAGDDPGEAEVLLDRAKARFRDGEIAVACDLALRAASTAGASNDPAHVLAAAALVAPGIPDPTCAATVEQLSRDALDALGTRDPAARARLHGQLAVALHLREQMGAAEEHIAAAETLAAQTGDPLAVAAALHSRQLAVAGLGDPDLLDELSDRMLAAAAAAAASAEAVDAEMLGLGWRVDSLLRRGDPPRAAHTIDSLDVLAVRSGRPLVRWNALLARAGLDHALGRFDEAVDLAAAARQTMPVSQRRMTEPLFVAQIMLVATDRGAEPLHIELARETVVGAPLIAVAMVGRYDLEMGDEASAQIAYEAVRARLDGVTLDRRGLPTLTAALTLAVHFGDAEVASTLRERLLPFDGLMIASTLGAVGPVGCFLADVELLLGRPDEAVAHLEAAAALAARAGYGPWLARARLAHARALLQRRGAGDRERATESAMLAATSARRLGMSRVRARADHLLETISGAGRLTPREREIAGLVATGSSNRDIAAALVLSDRTVETHVQNILTKLGFHSRTQIASWAVAEGIAAAPHGT